MIWGFVYLPAVNRDWSILTKLLLCFMHLANEVNKSFSRLWHSLFWPVCELELPHCSRLAILKQKNVPVTTSQPANNQKDNHEDMRAWGKMGREGQGRKIDHIYEDAFNHSTYWCFWAQWHKSVFSLTTTLYRFLSTLDMIVIWCFACANVWG